MGDMFRSEEMALCQLFIQPEAAYKIVSELGEAGCVQFRDLNTSVSAYQRKFVSEIRRCDELERKISVIKAELKNKQFPIEDVSEVLPRAPDSKETLNLEAQLQKTEAEIIELTSNNIELVDNYIKLRTHRMVLEKAYEFFEIDGEANIETTRTNLLTVDEENNDGETSFIVGIIDRDRLFSFERMLWRISRGYIFLKFAHCYEPMTNPYSSRGYDDLKSVFIAFYRGELMRQRIDRVCAGFHVKIYPCPRSYLERFEMIQSLSGELQVIKLVLETSDEHLRELLETPSKNLSTWSVMVKKMKAIFHTLNMFNMDVTRNCLIGECWAPIKDIPVIQEKLSQALIDAGSVQSFLNVINTNECPPSYNRLNKFTSGFQNLIDSYGIASYREANPALYTIITFPFLFAVMFGDLGHGLILFLFGVWMCIWERKLKSTNGGEIWNILFGGRYIILLMGIFSMYTGFTYNDVFSKSINLFGSTWKVNFNFSTVESNPSLQLNPVNAYNGVYPIGIDPIWKLAKNKILFFNSYKMKLSIIFGVLHMLFGVCLSVVNFNYYKKRSNILLEFLPQVLFLILLFGYMVFMMFFKWSKYSAKTSHQANTPGCAPSVLIMFINMMLFKSTKPLDGCKEFMFELQPAIERIFISIAIICIPWMLFGKPLFVKLTRKPRVHINISGHANSGGVESSETVCLLASSDSQNNDVSESGLPTTSQNICIDMSSETHDESNVTTDEHYRSYSEEEPISEVLIHQAIHTIEYILSTISHTASYLRLWALSLAHAQLSEVLWDMVLSSALKSNNSHGYIALYLIFGAWSFLTVTILVMMEGLSAVLHTLRLHWVEFMSKFYEGMGYSFQPFSFEQILKVHFDYE